MDLFKPSVLRHFLDSLGARAKKSLSQNFLIDGNILKKIIKTAKVEADDTILEIGPGPGALTQMLLNTGARILAVEKDSTFASALPRLTTNEEQLTVACEDILKFPIEETLSQYLSPGQKAKAVANLPYHLTTPILSRFIPLNHLFSSLVFMVQDEVAKRMTASPGGKEYSSLTVFLNYYAEVQYCFQISRNCFYPVPNVDSALVTLTLKQPPSVSSEEKFFLLTRTAFQQRRKMLRSSLRALYPPDRIMKALEELGHSPLARPEELSLNDFLLLFRTVSL